jgi:DNA invertase Pin-like site-specific DNA recombinase
METVNNNHQAAPLKFACLARVSTPGQQEKGESLEVQKAKLTKYVQDLGGTVARGGWYVGQEHSTPGNDRALLDRLLADATAHRFNAIVVDDLSRWGRDNLRSELALQVLKDNDIKFYVGTMEYDLFSPLSYFMLQTGVSFNQLYAMVLAEKSIRSKLKRLEEGKPAVGSLPWGRTFEKQTGQWGIDPTKQKLIQGAARDFLNGALLSDISARMDVSESVLYRLLRGAAGSRWRVTLKPKKFPRLARQFTLAVPPLLDEATLHALAKRLQAGRAFHTAPVARRRQRERRVGAQDFLFRRMMYCGECGYMLSCGRIGYNFYYIHTRAKVTGQKSDDSVHCPAFSYIPRDPIEGNIMWTLFEYFGDKVKRRELIRKADADMNEMEKLRADLKSSRAELMGVQKQQERLVDQASRGVLPEDKIQGQMSRLLEREQALKDRIAEAQDRLDNAPTAEEVDEALKALSPPRPTKKGAEEDLEWSRLGTEKHFRERMSFEDKGKLLRLILGSGEKASPARRRKRERTQKFVKSGVYIWRTAKGWKYEVRGVLPVFSGIIDKKDTLKLSEARS